MALALYVAVSTGQWDAVHHPTPSEKSPADQPRRLILGFRVLAEECAGCDHRTHV
jgi:hypothetical protein